VDPSRCWKSSAPQSVCSAFGEPTGSKTPRQSLCRGPRRSLFARPSTTRRWRP